MKTSNILLGLVVVVSAVAAVSILRRERLVSGSEARHSPRSVKLPVAENELTLATSAAQPDIVLPPTAANPSREDQLRELARTHARADIAGAIAWLRTLLPADAAVAIDAIFEDI